jgi:hypothetical protein
LFGKTLRYVATIEGHWLALLGWQAAALKCAARDGWIGWPRVLHYQRLHVLANNARFLILPSVGQVPNLASRVLAPNLRRLSADWQRVHGHPLLLAETFVDRAIPGLVTAPPTGRSLASPAGLHAATAAIRPTANPSRRWSTHCIRTPVRCYAPPRSPPPGVPPCNRLP